ncbi:MAG: hypothetical protein A2X94_01195 [Bdellovibrionales bacterium GWB1_55_8]|nr:MAG: hypothetical protein A2X94_01195 [Bdellovibrionales bacterium GWB1_55_8]
MSALSRVARFILLVNAAAAGGCAHYSIPATQLETPEARGALGAGRLELIGVQMGTDLSAQPSRPAPDPETGEVQGLELPLSTPHYAFGFTMGISKRVDVGVRLEPYSPLLLRAKYQYAGVSEQEVRQGNLSAAVSGAAGVMMSADAQFFAAHLGGPVGYRFAANHLVSVSPFLSVASISGPRLPAAAGADTLSASRFGMALGYQYTLQGLITRAELVRSWGSAGEPSIGGLFAGGMLGIAF